MTEDQLQSQCFLWACNERPITRLLLFHVPNGKKRTRREAATLKAMGVVRGVSDFIFYWAGRAHFIEMKTEHGTQSTYQKAFQKAVIAQGGCYVIAKSLSEFQTIIDSILCTQQKTEKQSDKSKTE